MMETLLVLVGATLLGVLVVVARIGIVVWPEFKEAERAQEVRQPPPVQQARVLPFRRKPPAA